MKLTVAVKLCPTNPQTKALAATLRRVNEACNYVSDIAWDTRMFGKYAPQKLVYHDVKDRFDLTA